MNKPTVEIENFTPDKIEWRFVLSDAQKQIVREAKALGSLVAAQVCYTAFGIYLLNVSLIQGE